MRLIKDLRGHIYFAVLGVLAIIAFSLVPKGDEAAYREFAASAAPSAADQIWQIGNQPINYLQEGKTQTSGEMWGPTSPTFQNINFVSPTANTPGGQGDVWKQLDAQVQSNEAQVANNPLPQSGSTFNSSPIPLSQTPYGMTTDQPPSMDDLRIGAAEDTRVWGGQAIVPLGSASDQPSFWSDPFGATTNWFGGEINSARNYFFGPPNMNGADCDGQTCLDVMGIRG